MATIMKRMRKLRERILDVRIGPGAAVLPSNVKKIHLDFRVKIEGGHRGARKFWREMLPRLKYRNPSIPMLVYRDLNPDRPSIMTIHFSGASPTDSPASADSPSATSTSEHTTADARATRPLGKRTETIDMLNKQEGEIWAELQALTGAVDVAPSELELAELAEIRQEKIDRSAQGVVDRQKMLEKRAEEKKLKDAMTSMSA